MCLSASKTCMLSSPETEDTAYLSLKTTTVEILFLEIINVQLKANRVIAQYQLSQFLVYRYSAGNSHVSYVIWRSSVKQKYFVLVSRVKQAVLLPGV